MFSVPLPPPHLYAVVRLAVVDRSFYSVRPGGADHLVCVGKEVLPLLLTVFSCATEPADLLPIDNTLDSFNYHKDLIGSLGNIIPHPPVK